MTSRFLTLLLVLCLVGVSQSRAENSTDRFFVVQNGKPLAIQVDPGAGPQVARAAADLAEDFARVTGLPAVRPSEFAPKGGSRCIIVGRLGGGGLVDNLVSRGLIDSSGISGKWEASVRAVVKNPAPEISEALVIAGSDARGAIFALYDISEEIGVSPWYWWADVPVARNDRPSVSASPRVSPGPSVQYRGIFINDEDWGLQPWAAKTFEPEAGGIGPKTYAKVCELLLRLKANTLWPAMHACSPAFNSNPENKLVADRYGIVMGTSHAEPMMRNNVREWAGPPENYNYLTNRDGVLRYWEERVEQNGRFENIYTIGMRGIHDSRMQGAKTVEEQRSALERIFADQRALLARHVNPDPARVPQIFCAYKEVLEVYRAGLRIPDDVTIVFPDDNFGYIRNFPSPEERKHPGGFGIYYHISYLGRPLSYLWLNTTPPALIWSEMSKAYDLGARRLWIVNVGDIKPAEIGTDFFLRLAYDVNAWKNDNVHEFLTQWASRTFGAQHAGGIAAIMQEYYRLNSHRKPEHLQWWLPNQPPVSSTLTPAERAARLHAFDQLRRDAERLSNDLPAAAFDAYYQLVLYPVLGAAAANERFLCNEEYERLKATDAASARSLAARAQSADAALQRETARYNETIANGKWRHMMTLEPADNQWKSMRIARATVPPGNYSDVEAKIPPAARQTSNHISEAGAFVQRDGLITIEAAQGTVRTPAGAPAWEPVRGLGRSGRAMRVATNPLPAPSSHPLTTVPSVLEYRVEISAPGTFVLELEILPAHPISTARPQRVASALDDAAPAVLEIAPHDNTPEWSKAVLEGVRRVKSSVEISQRGVHTLRILALEPGVVLDKIFLYPREQPPASTYFGPVTSPTP